MNDGNGGQNYGILFGGAIIGAINPAPLTVTAVTDTRTYDGTTNVSTGITPTVMGTIFGSDKANFTEAFDSRNAGSRMLVTSGLVNDGNGGQNYAVNFVPVSGMINPAQLTVAAVTNTRTYDGTTGVSAGITPTITGTVFTNTGDVANFTEAFDSRNAGSRMITAQGMVNDGNGGQNYAVTFAPSVTGTINPEPLTVTAVSVTKTYDGTTAVVTVPTITGTVFTNTGDVANFIETFDSRDAGARTLTPSGTVSDGNGGQNYTITFAPGVTGTINKAQLTISAASDSKVYDGSVSSSGMVQVMGLQGMDSASGFTQSFNSKNVMGMNGSTLSVDQASGVISDGNGGGNYTLSFNPAMGTIKPAQLTVTALTDTRTYDGTTGVSAGITPTITGTVFANAGDVANFSEAFDSRNAGSRMLVASGMVIDGNGGQNYAVNFVKVPGAINPAQLTVTALTDTRTYDGTTGVSAGITPTITGTVFTNTGDVANFVESFDSRNAGSRMLMASGMVNDGNGGQNYKIIFAGTTGMINPAQLTVTAVTDTKIYDGTTSVSAVITPTVAGTVFTNTGDVANFNEIFDSRNAGSQVLTASGLVNDGNGGGNYAITFVNATGTINKAALTVTEIADTKVFDGTTSATVSAQVSGLKGSDSASGLAESFGSANAGSRAMALGPLTVNDGNGGANYTLTVVNATGTITPAPLTITANNATQVVGTPEPGFSASFGPFPQGLGPSALDGMLSFTTNAPAGSPGSFKIFAGGLSSSNFDITFVPGTLLVTAANNALPPVPFSVDQRNTSSSTPAFSFTDPTLASLIVKLSDGAGSQTGNAGGPSVKGNLKAPTLDENGNPLGSLISFNSSFIEVCRTRVNLCR